MLVFYVLPRLMMWWRGQQTAGSAARRRVADRERHVELAAAEAAEDDPAFAPDAKLPKEPVLFLKATSAINGPYDDIRLPRGSTQTDWEVELGVVIGERAKYVSEADALDFVAGYCTSHDVSEREFQKERGGQWTKGKSCDTFGPIGPWLVTKDEVPDPHRLPIRLRLNGETMQNSNTQQMIFNVGYLLAYLSQVFTLEPGDLVFTGTPPGIGHAMKPPVYLKAGDEVEVEIDRLGTLRNPVRGE